MELIDKQESTPAQSWLGRVERRHVNQVDYSEKVGATSRIRSGREERLQERQALKPSRRPLKCPENGK